MYRLFAVTLPGLETFTRRELVELKLVSPEASAEGALESGGV